MSETGSGGTAVHEKGKQCSTIAKGIQASKMLEMPHLGKVADAQYVKCSPGLNETDKSKTRFPLWFEIYQGVVLGPWRKLKQDEKKFLSHCCRKKNWGFKEREFLSRT